MPLPRDRPAHVLFIAAVPPPEVAEAFARAWAAAGTGERFRRATLHMSLLAIAGLDRADPHLAALVGGAARRLRARAFALSFDRLVTFGHGPGRRPIVAATGGRSAAADALAAELHIAIRRADLRLPRFRRLTPHVTLAYGAGFPGYRPLTHPIRWEVAEITLIDSLQGQGRHLPLHRWRLAPGREGLNRPASASAGSSARGARNPPTP